MPKQSQLPEGTSPATTDFVSGYQASVPVAQRFKLSNLISLFWTLANIPTGGTNPITRDNETQFAFVASGGVWSGDSYGVNRNASMTSMVLYINGRRISIAAVTARTFTASKDTYIDVLDNLDGTGTLVYTEVANNAASPALAANSLRIGIIVTGATTIAAVGSVNQGQEGKLLPIASSAPYMVTDSLGNLICPRDPASKVLGYRQVLSAGTSQTAAGANTFAMMTAFNFGVPFIAPGNRKVKVTMFIPTTYSDTAAKNWKHGLWDGTVGSGTFLNYSSHSLNTGVSTLFGDRVSITEHIYTPSAGLHTINPGVAGQTGANYGQYSSQDGALGFMFIKIELA